MVYIDLNNGNVIQSGFYAKRINFHYFVCVNSGKNCQAGLKLKHYLRVFFFIFPTTKTKLEQKFKIGHKQTRMCKRSQFLQK